MQGCTSYRTRIDTDLFEGEQLMVFRDKENEKKGGNGKYQVHASPQSKMRASHDAMHIQAPLFEGKARLFVFQMQAEHMYCMRIY